MAKPEEFIVTIGPDGRIILDFRGMTEESYRRIVETLQETVGPVERIEVQADQSPPGGVRELDSAKIKEEEKAELKLGQRRSE